MGKSRVSCPVFIARQNAICMHCRLEIVCIADDNQNALLFYQFHLFVRLSVCQSIPPSI